MDQKQFEATLADAENRLRRLRTLYDQWFHGLERVEPRIPRQEVDRVMVLLRNSHPRNTALRFRLNQLVQRYTTYTNYWQRITRQIEEGTYKRDVERARRRLAKSGEPKKDKAQVEGYELDIDVELDAEFDAITLVAPIPRAPKPAVPPPVSSTLDAPLASAPVSASKAPTQVSDARNASLPASSSAAPKKVPAPPPVPTASASPRPKKASVRPSAPRVASSGMTDDQLASLYQRYLAARRDNRERTDNVKLESLAKTVRDMMPKLTQKHAGKHIDFDVVVRDGKVALKPVAK